jgi:hypothetical protein
MLKALAKVMGNDKPAVDMSELADVQAALASANLSLESKSAELASVLELVASFEADKAAMTAQLEALTASLAQAEDFSKAVAEKALQDKNEKRKAALVALVGTAKADATFSAVASLEDSAFDAVCQALKTTYDMESVAFEEVGADVVADPATVGLSPEALALREKYKNN